MVATLVRLDEHVDAKRQVALERFQPPLHAGGAATKPAGAFTPDEYRVLAASLLRLRMRQHPVREEGAAASDEHG